MKHIVNGALRCNRKSIATTGLFNVLLRNFMFSFLTVLLAGILITGCRKNDTQVTEPEAQRSSAVVGEENIVNFYTGLSNETRWELQQARAASARYRKMENAIKDGYIDIDVILPNMGHHYMKPSLVDENFDPKSPEILVYNKDDNGNFQLVAVEYAVPLNLPMPQGFSGSTDVWSGTSGFPLWLLHAWVWSYNPDGVFNPTNPLVHLH